MAKLELNQFRGNWAACGRAYGQRFEPFIMGFCSQEVRPNRARLAYARRCWPLIQRHAPRSAQFLKGLAAGCHLSLDHVTLLALHEEIYHQPHCTAFAAAPQATTNHHTLIGQNWDWNSALFPWPGLVRYTVPGDPAILAYHYPGLWCCAGVNSAGVGFMWTGAGYKPPVQPAVGVPTYVLIAEILRKPSVSAALAWLRSVPLAGAFVFFLGDAAGQIAIAEGLPGRLTVDTSDAVLTRGNHYACPASIRLARQTQHQPALRGAGCDRDRRMHALLQRDRGKLTLARAQSILLDRTGSGQWLHQYPHGPKGLQLGGLTIDSLLVECETRTLWTCRGGRVAGPWQRLRV